MAKRKAFLHVGLPHSSGPVYTAALSTYADALAAQGVTQPAASEDELFRAAVEIRRDHRAWGLRRKDVEGMWAGICRRAFHKGAAKGDVLVSHALLAGCTADEIDLLVDQLAGLQVHVIITAGTPDARVSLFPDDHDLTGVAERWSAAVGSPEQVHVVVTGPADPKSGWTAFGEIVGFDAAALTLPHPSDVVRTQDMAALRVIASSTASLASDDDLAALGAEWARTVVTEGYSVYGDPAALVPTTDRVPGESDYAEDRLAVISAALSDSIAELARLRARNTELAERAAKLERKRRKLKKRLDEPA